MVDENKIYNYIKSQINPYGKPFDGMAYEFGLKIMNYIENMEKVGEWIPCSERLPDESGTYIVNAIENGIIHVPFAKWMPRMKTGNLTGSRSYWKVNAWQPLPESYNTGKE